jgi:hypothetical protein
LSSIEEDLEERLLSLFLTPTPLLHQPTDRGSVPLWMIASIRSRLLHLAELTNEETFAGLDSPVASELIRETGTGRIDVCVRESTHAARDPLVTLERRKELFQIGSRAKRRQIAIVFAREAFARVSVAEPCGYDHRRRGRGS